MYLLLSGYLPFQGPNSSVVYAKIRAGKYHFDHDEFKLVSDEAKDLITQMLQVDPKKRISGSEALQHPWIKRFLTIKDSEIDNKLNSDIISSLR